MFKITETNLKRKGSLMKKLQKLTLLASAMMFTATGVYASELSKEEVTKNVETTMGYVTGKKDFKATEVTKITDSNAFYLVEGGEVPVMMSGDGKYVIEGQLFVVNKEKLGTMEGITSATQKMALARLNTPEFQNSTIDFKAKDEKHVVYAFVDITCHFCKKLFEEIPNYSAKGITVRLLAYPREGVDGTVAMKMEGIFTAKDKQDAYTKAENGGETPMVNKVDIVKKHYDLGGVFGVTGTPAIVLSNGTLLPGYMPADRLLETIENYQAK